MPSGFMTISPGAVGEEKRAHGENLDKSMLYRMTAISKKNLNVHVRPFEKTVFGGRFNSLSVSVYVCTCISIWEESASMDLTELRRS